jgi:hypothetical protein
MAGQPAAEPQRNGRRRGRPPGSRVKLLMSPETFRAEYRALEEEHRRRRWPDPTQIDLSVELDCHRCTIYRYLDRHGMEWPPRN